VLFRSAPDLSVGQASFLAGLPQAPSDYNPFGPSDQLAATKMRWREVLDGMGAGGDLSSSGARAISGGALVRKMLPPHKTVGPAHNPLTAHFVDYVVSYIKQRYGE